MMRTCLTRQPKMLALLLLAWSAPWADGVELAGREAEGSGFVVPQTNFHWESPVKDPFHEGAFGQLFRRAVLLRRASLRPHAPTDAPPPPPRQPRRSSSLTARNASKPARRAAKTSRTRRCA